MGELDLQGVDFFRRLLFPNERDRLQRQAQTAGLQNQLTEQQAMQQWMATPEGRTAMQTQFGAPAAQVGLVKAQTGEAQNRGNLYGEQAKTVAPESQQNIAASKANVNQNQQRIDNEWLRTMYDQYQQNAERAQRGGQFDTQMSFQNRQLDTTSENDRLRTAAGLLTPVPSTTMEVTGTGKNAKTTTRVNPQAQPVLNSLGFGTVISKTPDPQLQQAANAVLQMVQGKGQASTVSPTVVPSLPITAGSAFRPGGVPQPTTPMPEDSWLKRAGRWLMNPPETESYRSMQQQGPVPTTPPPADPRISKLLSTGNVNHAQSAQYASKLPQDVPQLMSFISQEVQKNPQLLQEMLVAMIKGGV